MSEVSAMCQVQTEDGVTRLEQGGHGGGVSLGARMGLNVGVLRAKQLLYSRDGELLDGVDVLASP